jgi:hypothetical protein
MNMNIIFNEAVMFDDCLTSADFDVSNDEQ